MIVSVLSKVCVPWVVGSLGFGKRGLLSSFGHETENKNRGKVFAYKIVLRVERSVTKRIFIFCLENYRF